MSALSELRAVTVSMSKTMGRRYLEAMSALWCASLGFSNERLVRAGSDALHTLPYYHMFNGRSNAAAVALADKLLELAPVPMSKVFFAHSGSEANDKDRPFS